MVHFSHFSFLFFEHFKLIMMKKKYIVWKVRKKGKVILEIFILSPYRNI